MIDNKSFLTNRQMQIARVILEMDKEFSAQDIVKETGVPKSAFYYEMNLIKVFFEKNGIQIIRTEKNIYKLEGSPKKKQELVARLQKKEGLVLISDNKERNNYVILLLLCLSEPVMIKDIMTRFKISKPTAIKNFQYAKEYLEKEHLMVYSRPNYGSYVSGNEIFIRSAFTNVIIDNYLNEMLKYFNKIRYSTLSLNEKELSITDIFLFDYLSVDLVKKCIRIIDDYETAADVAFGDVARLSTILQFAFTAKRIYLNRTVEMQKETIEDLHNYENYEKMLIYIKEYEKAIGVPVPENEAAYLMITLMNGKGTKEDDHSSKNPSHFEFCDKITKAVIQEAAIYLSPKIIYDEVLYKNLFNHLMAVIYRCKNQIPIKNQLLPTIRDSYPYTFFVADRCRQVIENIIGVPVSEDESGYLALYLEISKKQSDRESKEIKAIVVCAEGMVTSWLIAANISKFFPEIKIVKVLSIHDYEKLKDIKDIDLLISTSKEIKADKITTIVVNPILCANDMEELDKCVKKHMYMNEFETVSSNGRGILTFLDNDQIQIDQIASGWKDAVDKASQPLLKKGIITEEYIQAIKYNIIKYGPYVVSLPGIAILHASHNIPGIKLGICLTTLAVPVNFGKEENDPVSIIFTLSSPDENSHMQILEDLVELFQNDGFFTRIKNAKTEGEIRNIVLDILTSH